MERVSERNRVRVIILIGSGLIGYGYGSSKIRPDPFTNKVNRSESYSGLRV